MGVRNQFIQNDEICPVDPPNGSDCEGTSIIVSFESVSTGLGGFFATSGSTDAPGGMQTDYPEWFFREPIGGDTLGPVNASNSGSFTTWTLVNGPNAGAILNIDWTDINKPVFSQSNGLSAGIVILGGVTFRDVCNNVVGRRGQIAFSDDPNLPAPDALVFWDGDPEEILLPGTGTAVTPDAVGSSAGFVTWDGNVRDGANTANYSPTPGAEIDLVFRDGTNGRTILSVTLDYSANIDLTTVVPTSETVAAYTRTDGSTASINWANLQSYFGAGASITGGVINAPFDKLNFAIDNNIFGCFTSESDNAVQIDVIASVRGSAGATTSPTSKLPILRQEYGPNLAQPYGITEELISGSYFSAHTAIGLSNVLEIEDLGNDSFCVRTREEFRNEVETIIGMPITGVCVLQGITVDTNRLVNSRHPLLVVCGDNNTANGGLLVGTWNPTSGEWDVTYNATGFAGARSLFIDLENQINGRPIIWNDQIGLNSGFFYYSGAGETYLRHVFAPYPFGVNNGAGHPVQDPDTGILYFFAETAANGLQAVHTLELTGPDALVSANWTSNILGYYEGAIDVDGPLNAATGTPGTVGFNPGGVIYSGSRENGEPTFYFTDEANNKIKELFYNGAAWEIRTLGGTGTAASTAGDLATVAEFNRPTGLHRLSDGRIGIIEFLGNAFRLWNETSGEVTLPIGPTVTGLVDHLYI